MTQRNRKPLTIFVDEEKSEIVGEDNTTMQSPSRTSRIKPPGLMKLNIDSPPPSSAAARTKTPVITRGKELTHIYDYLSTYYKDEIENEIKERINNTLSKMDTIRNNVIVNFNNSSKDKTFKQAIKKLLLNEKVKPMVKKTNPLLLIYKYKYNGQNCIIKLYFPERQQNKGEFIKKIYNEVTFQLYALELNSSCKFKSPKIYKYGKISDIEDIAQLMISDYHGDCYFMLMEYIDYKALGDLPYRDDRCNLLSKKINDLDACLSMKLLAHNDLNKTNLRIKNYGQNDESLALIDFGESKNVQSSSTAGVGIGFEYNCDVLKKRQLGADEVVGDDEDFAIDTRELEYKSAADTKRPSQRRLYSKYKKNKTIKRGTHYNPSSRKRSTARSVYRVRDS